MGVSESITRARSIVEGYDGPKIRIMEVCGTHTHEIFRLGIRNLLPDNVELISGPGCPVCVTPIGYIDEAVWLALENGVTICTFGDLIRVPGTDMSLGQARSRGAKIKIVYSQPDALEYAESHPDEEVVFLSVGFETTTPGACIAVRNAKAHGTENFSILTANKTMYNAYLALKDSADAFMYPGHVSTMTGMSVYRTLRDENGISGAVTGFTASEIITSLATMITRVIESRESEAAGNGPVPFAENCYPRVVSEEGSPAARKLVGSMMDPIDSEWRGLGVIPKSGLKLNEDYSSYDARKKYGIPEMKGRANPACHCGEVLLGECKPYECPIFGSACTPEHPVGACMVSSEGACSAYYKYGSEDWRKSHYAVIL